jgi:tRNA modification GTPase
VTERPTYTACLTPPGTAAIATIAVRGPQALNVVQQLFRSTSQSLPTGAGRFLLGKFGDEATDDVVLIIKQMEPIPWLELHCHGGQQVIRMLLETLERHGTQICSWQELERRTTERPLAAEARVLLAEARTVRTAAILLDQLHGACERAVEEIIAELDKGDAVSAVGRLEALARHSGVGRHLTRPWKVVVAGAPNVGKSSLVNALAGYQRSIVSPIPGTTRDVVGVSIAIDGWPIELTDTAGLREQVGGLEEQGMRLAEEAIASADLSLWVLDGANAGERPSEADHKTQLVLNKADLPAAWDWDQVPAAIRVSARTGIGMDDLCQAISRRLVPEAPPAGAAVPFTAALGDHLDAACRRAREGKPVEARALLEISLRSPPTD